MKRVADMIAEILADAGIRHVFMVTGGGAMHLNDAMGRCDRLSVVCCHHEQACAMAAEAYCRLSGRLAAVNVTTGPGGINAMNGVYGAFVDSIGMIVVSGQVKRETIARNDSPLLRQLGDQEVDIVSLVRPITKMAVSLDDPEQVRVVLEQAIFLAQHGRPGPVWIDVPIDVQSSRVDEARLPSWDGDISVFIGNDSLHPNARAEFEVAFPSDKDLRHEIEKVLDRLREAKRPVIMAGTGVRISGSHDLFLRFIERLGIPVVSGWNAHDVLPNEHPCYAGRPGTVGDRAGNFTVQNADFLLVLGCRLNIRQVSYNWKSFADRAWKAHVDIDRAELEKHTLSSDLKIRAHLRDFLRTALEMTEGWRKTEEHDRYLSWCRGTVERYPVVLPSYRGSELVNPYCFMESLFAALDPGDVVVTGNGSACVVSFQTAYIREGQRLFTNSGCASMGYDVPAAMGACIARGGGRVVCLAGDGSIMMNLQELATIIGNGWPVKIFVLNNNGYHSIRQTQQAYFPDRKIGIDPETGVFFPGFQRLGAAFGYPAILIDRMEQVDAGIRKALNSDGPSFCEVRLDSGQEFAPKLASRMLPDGTMASPRLEDMAPFLSREELAREILEG